MVEKFRYGVTERAGKYVAGMPNQGVGTVLTLTEKQAHYEVQLGTLKKLVPVAGAAPAPEPEDTVEGAGGGEDTVSGGEGGQSSDEGSSEGGDTGGEEKAAEKPSPAASGDDGEKPEKPEDAKSVPLDGEKPAAKKTAAKK